MRVDELINELQDLVADAKAVPLTGGKVIVEAEKIYDILDEIQDTLPAEVRQAKNIVSDRGQIIAEAKKEAEAININSLKAFFESDIYKRISSAEKYVREQEFSMSVPV